MGLLDSIKKLFAGPKHVTRFEDLAPGPVVVDGEVRVGEAGPLLSPIKGQQCVAFIYTASYQTPVRSTQMMQRPLRNVEGFQAFKLELEGGRIEAVPQAPGGFTREEHQALASTGYQNFKAEEEVVPARARVRLRGVAKRSGAGWVVTYRRIERLKGESSAKRPRKRKR